MTSRIEGRRRRSIAAGIHTPTSVDIDWDPRTAAAIICDMWDAHHCRSAAARVVEMAPHVNDVVSELRRRGTFIIHAPSSCTGFYDGSPERRRAIEAPHARAPVEIDWNDWNPEREADLGPEFLEPGPCSCRSAAPCCEQGPPYPWTRQIASIRIRPEDAVSDNGQEVYNLLRQREVRNVLVLGVHTNLCVLGRPFGIRQLVYLGLNPLLCRDLTDAFHRHPAGHVYGTDLAVGHIETYWCPSVTSDQLVGGLAFQFSPLVAEA
jgi:nicotinamidase-related amidase